MGFASRVVPERREWLGCQTNCRLDVMPLESRPRERLADQVYGKLLEDIASGGTSVGDRLPTENQLAENFGVSRPVVREALTRLASDGFIASRQGAGTFVRNRPPSRLLQFANAANLSNFLSSFEVRIALEGEASRLAAIRRSSDDIARITVTIRELEAGIMAGTATTDSDFDFHRAIARASGNPLLLEIVTAVLAPRAEPGAGTMPGYIRGDRVLDEHNRIAEAIIAGQAESASLAMRYHIDQARIRLTDVERDL
jgi:GntR family transcriptional regulator, transcriptional repressor for pyruvate dehydrogenase complex